MTTKAETETLIILNDEDEFAVVDTMHGRVRRACEEVIRRMGRGRERNLDHGIHDGKKVRWEFEIPVEAIRVPMAPPAPKQLTTEEREKIGQRLKDARSRRESMQAVMVGDPDAAGEGRGQG